jgi:hypothetical protein
MEPAVNDLDAFMEDAEAAPWRPESDVDGDGLRRRRYTIWLTNDGGDSLQVDEDTAAMLVNALQTLWSEERDTLSQLRHLIELATSELRDLARSGWSAPAERHALDLANQIDEQLDRILPRKEGE